MFIGVASLAMLKRESLGKIAVLLKNQEMVGRSLPTAEHCKLTESPLDTVMSLSSGERKLGGTE